MLKTLRIKNLALVTDLTLDFKEGYNAVTGETGAGKSIIIGAINLILGERADRSLIRAGCDSCTVEAVFDVSRMASGFTELLQENGCEPPEGDELLIKRSFSASGSNKQFINGSPTTAAILARVGQDLVDMHGPHDHQSLLQPGKQLLILDDFGQLAGHREAYRKLLHERARLESAKTELIVDEHTYAQQLDLLRHQVQEIRAAKLRVEEEEELEAEHRRATNAARLLELSQNALALLEEDESSVTDKLGTVGRFIADLERLDAGAGSLARLQEQITELSQELKTELARYRERLDLDPERLSQLEERVNLVHGLKRKYGRTIAEVLAFEENAARKLDQLESREAEVARLDAELQKNLAELLAAGNELSARRKKMIPKLAKAATRELEELGFKQSFLDVQIEPVPAGTFGPFGLDKIELVFAPNPGEPAKPLRAIASSGEMARVMLALKTVLASVDQVPVLVFDEVDANVGGETAAVVGSKMNQIGARRQVLCITHLAQVASAAPTHFMVTKQLREGRTVSEIEKLDKSSRVSELARMLGGGEPARQHAVALLK